MGFPVPGGTALVVAGIDASTKDGLPLGGVIAAGALGALVGGTAGFAVGRWRGEQVLLRVGRLFGQEPERVQELRGQFKRHAIAPLFIARFITGLRNAAGLVAGASGVPLARFLAVSAVAALAWSALITLEYYFAGHAILGAPTWLQIVLIIAGVFATIASYRLLGRRAAGRGANSWLSPEFDLALGRVRELGGGRLAGTNGRTAPPERGGQGRYLPDTSQTGEDRSPPGIHVRPPEPE